VGGGDLSGSHGSSATTNLSTPLIRIRGIALSAGRDVGFVDSVESRSYPSASAASSVRCRGRLLMAKDDMRDCWSKTKTGYLSPPIH